MITSDLYPVLAVPTYPDAMDDGERVPMMARSRTGAIRAVRSAGWHVMTVGGLVDLVDTDRGMAWCVTVHPAK